MNNCNCNTRKKLKLIYVMTYDIYKVTLDIYKYIVYNILCIYHKSTQKSLASIIFVILKLRYTGVE